MWRFILEQGGVWSQKIHFKKAKRPVDLVCRLSICPKPSNKYIIKHLAVAISRRCLPFNLGILDPVLSNKIFLTKFGWLEQNFWCAMGKQESQTVRKQIIFVDLIAIDRKRPLGWKDNHRSAKRHYTVWNQGKKILLS